jgi:chaperonin GroES
VGKLRPLFDRVLVQVAESKAQTRGGVLLPESAKEKPAVGTVVAAGPGKKDEPMKLKPGDKVVYFKYAGDKMQDDKGNEFVVLHQNDCLGTL